MFFDFMIRAALAGLGVAAAAAPLGCFVVWRRMAYFGDATAHAAVLGVAIALMLNISVFAGVLLVALLMAVVIAKLSDHGHAMDTLLGVMAHSTLAIGLVAVSFLQGVRVDLNAYLFGDILAVGWQDVALIWGGAALVLVLVLSRWSPLLTATLSPELAVASGINPKREQLVLTVALALVVAVAIKIVGALMIAAMLIIPAAAARTLSRSPESMAIGATIIASVSVLAGLVAAYHIDTPAGPSIVACATVLFAVTVITGLVRRQA